MKITVYAICKNESAFVERWVRSMREADEIVVLDTGSTDDSVLLLRSLGVKVERRLINPWRFDNARNISLSLVPPDTDICVCTDLDEVFDEGWREKLENSWSEGVTQTRYDYIWSHEGEGVRFYGEKIHAYGCFEWINPVHEVLKFTGKGNQKQVIAPITLHHYPDHDKPRSSYLPLLELAVKENPNDDRSTHYLGREYMFYAQYQKAIDTLLFHLSMPSATWKDERAASLRYIGRCYQALNDYQNAERFFAFSVVEKPSLREGYIEYARLLFAQNSYNGCIFLLQKALEITRRELTYISEPFAWGEEPYDLLALSYYAVGDYEKALHYGEIAVSFSPCSRLLQNLEFYKSKVISKKPE